MLLYCTYVCVFRLFYRWMPFEPDYNGWNSYVKLEMRHGNVEKARSIFERWYVTGLFHPHLSSIFIFILIGIVFVVVVHDSYT